MEKSYSRFVRLFLHLLAHRWFAVMAHSVLAVIETDLLLWKFVILFFVRLFLRPLARRGLVILSNSSLAAIETGLRLWKWVIPGLCVYADPANITP